MVYVLVEQYFVNDFFHRIAVLPKDHPVGRCYSRSLRDTPNPVKSLCNIESSDRPNHDSCRKIKSWLLHNV